MEICSTDVPRIRKEDLELMSDAEITWLEKRTKALSDPIRIQMLHLLSQTENLCTCEFEEMLGLNQSKVSYHLRELLQAGLVERESRGTWSHYRSTQPQILDHLMDWFRPGQGTPFQTDRMLIEG